MKIAIIASQRTDISHLLTSVTWSGDVSQAARKLDFTFVQDDRDKLIPVIDVDTGYTVWAADDKSKICFVGNLYQMNASEKIVLDIQKVFALTFRHTKTTIKKFLKI